MKRKLKPEIFFFEFATCGGEVPDSILVEGLGMFNALYNDFSFAEIRSFIRGDFKDLFELPTTNDWEKSFEECLDSEYALIIAPEDDFLLYDLTRKIEKADLNNLGSSSKAISVTSDKWRLYKKLKRKVNMPKTSKKPINDLFVIKPRVSCGGENIKFASLTEIEEGYIAQEYVKGNNISLSFIVGDEVNLISINKQIIDNFRYNGAIVPFEIQSELREQVVDECIKAIECVKGLFGYVGVDVVLSDVPYIIEVNARLTTPSILFKDVYGINLAEVIFKNYHKEKIEFEMEKKFKAFKLVKEEGNHGFIRAKGFSLVKTPLN